MRVGESYLNQPSQEVRLEFLRLGDSTHSYRRRFRLLPGLTADDQSALNRVETSQAQMEVAYAESHALRDLGQEAPALARAAQARAPAESLIADVRAPHQPAAAAGEPRGSKAIRQRAGQREALVWLLFASAIVLGVGTAFVTVRSIDSPLQQLIDAARRFGDGDLRPTELGEMPAELATLARAMGQMGAKLRGVIDSVIRESKGIGLSAGDLSAMSEELAAGSSEIVRAIGGVTQNAGTTGRRGAERRRGHRHLAGDGGARRHRGGAGRGRGRAGVAARGSSATRPESRPRTASRRCGRPRRAGGAGARDLARHADRIGELLDLTRQLGAQSEVLSLNASIEAARAAEDGAACPQSPPKRGGWPTRVARPPTGSRWPPRRCASLVSGQGGAIQDDRDRSA